MGAAENFVENYLTEQAAKHGMLFYKLRTPGSNGIPDRMIINNGRTAYIELKSSTGKLSAVQRVVIRDLLAHGAEVHVLNSREQVDELITDMKG